MAVRSAIVRPDRDRLGWRPARAARRFAPAGKVQFPPPATFPHL